MPIKKGQVVVVPFTVVGGKVKIVIFSENGQLSFQEVSYDKKVHGKIVDFETSSESLLGKQMKDGVAKVVFIDTPVKRWKNKAVSLFSKKQIVGETVTRLFEVGFSMLYSEDTASVNQNTESSPAPKQNSETVVVFSGRDDVVGREMRVTPRTVSHNTNAKQVCYAFDVIADKQQRRYQGMFPGRLFWCGKDFVLAGLKSEMEVIATGEVEPAAKLKRYYVPELQEMFYFYEGMLEAV